MILVIIYFAYHINLNYNRPKWQIHDCGNIYELACTGYSSSGVEIWEVINQLLQNKNE